MAAERPADRDEPASRGGSADPPVVVVAARDEGDRIGDALDAIALAFPGAPRYVADDGSTDETARVAAERGARVVGREPGQRSLGKGGNMTAACERALADHGEGHTARVFLLCDADLGETAGGLAPLVGAVIAGECELAIAGFARREGGGIGLALGASRDAVRKRTGEEIESPLSGQRAMTAATLRDVLPFAPSYGMETGMTIDAIRAGHRVKEIQLDLAHRATGRTLGGFIHRGRQWLDIRRASRARR